MLGRILTRARGTSSPALVSTPCPTAGSAAKTKGGSRIGNTIRSSVSWVGGEFGISGSACDNKACRPHATHHRPNRCTPPRAAKTTPTAHGRSTTHQLTADHRRSAGVSTVFPCQTTPVSECFPSEFVKCSADFYAATNPNTKYVLILRDPRDIAVSAVHYEKAPKAQKVVDELVERKCRVYAGWEAVRYWWHTEVREIATILTPARRARPPLRPLLSFADPRTTNWPAASPLCQFANYLTI